MKKIFYLIMGFIIFLSVYILVEYIVVGILGMKLIFIELLKEDILHCAFLYSLSLFSYFIINYISNIFVVKSLNKKIIILISIIIILAVIFSFFQIRKSYLFNADNNGIIDGKAELINRLEKIEDKEERKKQIDYSVKQKVITQEEADKLY